MRYLWALLAYVTAIVVVSASCSATGKGTGFTGSTSGGMGGQTATGAGGNGGSLSIGAGGGLTINDAGNGDGGTCSAYKGTCATQKLDCGMAADGCGNILNCGTCTGNDSCGGSGTANVCGAPKCTPKTCASQMFNCGMATDGCGNTLTCGTSCPTGETCGAKSPNQCGTGGCTPTTCAANGWNCGMQGDGCGNLLDCGTCTSGETCGGGTNPKSGVCGSGVTCTPATCASQGFNCGMATDGCNNILDCGTCTGTEICGAAGPNVCGAGACSGLCLQQTTCTGTATTSITGTVYAPNGTDPVYNTLVYVPNSAVLPFVDGVNIPHCSCGSDVSGSPLVSTATAIDGTFTLTNMPVGTDIPLVIQNGRWRRQIVIPSVAACVNTVVPATLTNMPNCHTGNAACPSGKAQGDIPLMAFATGSVDSLECVMRKIGIVDSEFTNPGGTGRVQFYVGSGVDPLFGIPYGGAQINASTPSETALVASQAAINAYDMVLFPCQGEQFDQTKAAQNFVIDYANAGGRVFATHYSYVWLYDDTPFSTTAQWDVDQTPNFNADPENGTINQTFPKGLALAQWLKLLYPASTQGTIQLNTLRNDFDGVIAPSSLWIYITDPNYTNQVPMHYTFDTPVGTPPASQCGRVLYDDFHVEDAENNPTTGVTFPAECNNSAMTPQEKMLEFMLFDLGSCVAPPVCVPTTCAAKGATCGPIGDTCGNILECGTCPSGEVCTNGTCGNGGCVPKTCAAQSFACGSQGDGCGNAISCGTCPSGESCTNGVCGSGGCTAQSCAQQSTACGSIGDGCGNIQNCGVCPSGEVCTNGACVTPACTPKTCASQGFNCGSATDGCNHTLSCGTCSGNQTCGGGGIANQCGGGAG